MFRLLASLRARSGTLIATATSSLVKTDNTSLAKGVRNLTVSSKLFSDEPQIQKPAPNFSGTAVVKGDFKEIKLSDYKGKYIVLFFYPLDFTFVCPTEIIAFSEKISEFEALNTQVIGVSTDSHFSHLAWINTPRKQGGLGGDLGYPLLSDFNKTISTKYNVLLQDSGIALRGLFIIDKEGVLRQYCVNDLPVGRSVEETLRLIKAFQFVEKHGEVCPANWQPDSKTIKPNPKDSKQYFESVN
ncbi:PREDICTED: peroxiredoxin [Cyphomyrmex costatus]|uniref:thioredoxin-dependent peroxiredoxin n=1 Tax=Cyphomyrmex costatus TaxID=456900 RepID=A0A195C2N1_9HYME|nr:PREDICTED: peroxiredoxin [Cyphomyrmex costatus]KYM94448.1 Thioredoxin-dependent peroxide reductase, mitochondrial [Cyphomyrmex costatus]